MDRMTIKIPQYFSQLKVGFAENFLELADAWRIQEHRDVLQDAGACYIGIGGTVYLFYKPDVSPGIIVHEVSHALDYLLERIGVQHVDTEIRSYHLHWLVDEIWKKWTKLKS